jgi:GTP-binding protein
MSMPFIAIVGRPNVGKSSLLNALTHKRISIVQDMPGVTRDRISIPLAVGDRFVELVDTGGYGFDDPQKLTEHIKHQIEVAMARANLVLFIVDAQTGLSSADEQIASLLRRKGIKTVLIANKADGDKSDAMLSDFSRLGLGTPLGVSAMNGRNVEEIFKVIEANVDLANAPTEVPEPEMMVAIVGKRNAGKSTLVNAIAKLYGEDDDRVIVSEVPGTTRDSVDVRFEKEGKSLVVIDTAGVRKKRHMVTNDIEFYSFHRAERSIRRANVVMLLLDGTEPVSEPDRKLATYIAEQLKPVLIVVNKWDLAIKKARDNRPADDKGKALSDEELMEEFRGYLDLELRNIDYAPIAFVTAKEGRNIQAVVDMAQHLFNQANERLTTGRLNQAVKQILAERTPSTPRGQRVRVYYATQVGISPPTIVLFVNNPEYVNEQYQRFIINRFRDLLPFPEVPIRLILRGKGEANEPDELTAIESRGRVQRQPKKPAPNRGAKGRPARPARQKVKGKRQK